MLWVPIKDGKTKLWENEATHLRINKKAWIRVHKYFFGITWRGDPHNLRRLRTKVGGQLARSITLNPFGLHYLAARTPADIRPSIC